MAAIVSDTAVALPEQRANWRRKGVGLIAMTRPSVVALVFFTGVPALAIDDGMWPNAGLACAILLGVTLCACSSSVFNAWLERDIDAKMDRTRTRPLPTGLIAPRTAWWWAWSLAIGGTGTLWVYGGWQGALAGALTIAFYVFVYTIWLKPRTPLNIVIGGAAGAAPPLIVDAALHGRIGLQSLCLFVLVFLWTPPHFWAISLFRAGDYAKAGLPMLPLTHGEHHTRLRIVQYALSLAPFALLPAVTRNLSLGYAAVALLASAWFVWKCVQLYRRGGDSEARRVFGASLVYLHVVFSAMTIDLLVR